MIIPITDYVQANICKKVEIEVIQYNLNVSATCNVNFLDDKDNKLSSVLVYIDGDDFNVNWSSDEDLVRIVLTKLGLVPLSSS